jgi:hypothetical protein
LKWVKDNKWSFVGSHMEHKPWWPKLPLTSDAILLHARRRLLESACFENALRQLCETLIEAGIDYPQNYKALKKAVDHRAIMAHYQLVAFKAAGHAALNLAELAKRFDYKSPSKMRGMVADMAELGFWDVLVGNEDHEPFSISIGLVAWVFHHKVLFPAIEHFAQDPSLNPRSH